MVHTELTQKIKTHFYNKKTPPPPENRPLHEKTLKIYGGAGEVTNANIVRRLRIACRIPQATNTHSQHVVLIAFPPTTMVTRTRLSVTL